MSEGSYVIDIDQISNNFVDEDSDQEYEEYLYTLQQLRDEADQIEKEKVEAVKKVIKETVEKMNGCNQQ